MRNMGRYCKAYPIEKFRAYPGWSEKPIAPSGEGTGEDQEAASRPFLYLQENYVVTGNIFIDEEIVFDEVTPEWIEFCKNTLGFEIPAYAHAAAEGESATGTTENVQ